MGSQVGYNTLEKWKIPKMGGPGRNMQHFTGRTLCNAEGKKERKSTMDSLNFRHLLLRVLEAVGPRSRWQHSQFHLEASSVFLTCRQLPSWCMFIWALSGHSGRETALWNLYGQGHKPQCEGTPLMNLSNCNSLTKALSLDSTALGVKASTYEFGQDRWKHSVHSKCLVFISKF